MGDLYSRVYNLPDRMLKARARLAKLQHRLENTDPAERWSLKADILRAERRLLALETEARQYNFHDLLTVESE